MSRIDWARSAVPPPPPIASLPEPDEVDEALYRAFDEQGVYLDGVDLTRIEYDNPDCRVVYPQIVANMDTFDADRYVAERGRRTRYDPLLFSLLYFSKHLSLRINRVKQVALSAFNVQMCHRSLEWAMQDLEPKASRHAEIAPRHSGKSTWNFLIRPAWALAWEHKRFVLAYACVSTQATRHLSTFRKELAGNQALKRDFPAFCTPQLRQGTRFATADRYDMFIAASGAIFTASGIDNQRLGLKVEDLRPDILLFDDIEPDASNYSILKKDKRLATLIGAVFPMNEEAGVVISGTVNMAGALVHDLLKQVTEPDHPDLPLWPAEENIRVHYVPALYQGDEGEWRSCWPQKWSVEWMRGPAHIRADGTPSKKRRCETGPFLLSKMNSPRGVEGNWWTLDDYQYECIEDNAPFWSLQIDPAVTATQRSDYTAFVVTCFKPLHPGGRQRRWKPHKGDRIEVVYAAQFKMVADKVRDHAASLIQHYPRIRSVFVESNQGGDMWRSLLTKSLPSKANVVTYPSTEHKHTRLERALGRYQDGQVYHHSQAACRELEEWQLNYPKGIHDDLPDAAAMAINRFVKEAPEVGIEEYSYIGPPSGEQSYVNGGY